MPVIKETQTRFRKRSQLPNNGKVARHKVREIIQNQILDGKYVPGTRLNQARVAKNLNVSIGLVREALFELKASGLVKTIDNRGVFVAKLTLDVLRELYEVREIHEGLAARRCCGRVDSKQLATLVDMVEEIRAIAKTGNQKKASELDKGFHMKLIKLSGNETLKRLFETHQIAGKVVWSKVDPDDTYSTHMAILESIRKNLPDEAERLMREHIRNGFAGVEKFVQKEGIVFHWIG